ncbi:sugar ABC transporter ATP-binding protein [Flexilinea flocculi]|uniref:ABC-type sugar transport system, ATPase component n=1 Tax=Flexilinea flocculi TaxID=1678840 RepID=A0A0S7BUF5_9CHLR|nr:sugar ABC transporter ATP-binding protein [Flexilinea flocculi]GAP40544.1 ABC-type sugar transport system, ATPase component [Flexilinea flocculi]
MDCEYFLEMFHINKTFPGAKVLNDISLKIKPGEIRALVGENGAGKSTLIKILGGIYKKDNDDGLIKINGETVEINSVEEAKKYGICIIHQEISLADNMSVADNLFMGAELMTRNNIFLNDKEMIFQSQKIMDEMGVDIDVTEKVGSLSIAKQQMVEISRSLLTNARLIVMDEPTSSLTSNEIVQLFYQIDQLKQAGIAIIYISHRLPEIFRVSDSITILRDGNLIGTHKTSDLSEHQIISMMVGREISEIYSSDKQIIPGPEFLSVTNLSNKKLRNIKFSLRKGEILGFAGLIGAGRTELARAIFGIDKISSGEIFIKGKKIEIKHPMDAINCGIGYVPENRKTEGLFLNNTIRYNISITILEKFIQFIHVNRKKEKSIVDNFTKFLDIKMVSADQEVMFLSGGNQQKVLVSKWLTTEPSILILDEPTRGIDIGSKSEIYHLINRLAQKGIAIILISSEMDEIVNLCNRVIVMHEGEITGELENSEIDRLSQERIMWLAAGGNG